MYLRICRTKLLLSYVLLMWSANLMWTQSQHPDPPANFALKSSSEELGNRDIPSLAALPANSYFKQNLKVNQDPSNLENDTSPAIAIFGDSIYVVWSGDTSSKAIYFARSIDNGASWSTPVRINDTFNYPPGFYAFQPDIAVNSNGDIFIIWHDYRFWSSDTDYNSPIEIFIDKSTDGGLTWGTDVQATSGAGVYPWHYQGYIAINQSNDNIYISFTDLDRYDGVDLGDISLVSSYDGGQSFNSKMRVDDLGPTSIVSQSFSDISVDPTSNNIYIAFEDTRNGDKDIFIAVSTDSGVSIDTNIQVNTISTGIQDEPSLAIDTSSQTLYVAWKDSREDMEPDSTPYLNHIYLAKTMPGYNSFSPGVRVSDTYMNAETGFNFPPDLIVDPDGVVVIVWHDSRRDFSNVFYDQSLDGGIHFGEDIQINTNEDTLTHALPRIELDDEGKSYIVWFDDRNEVSDNSKGDIFIAGSAFESCDANILMTGVIASGDYQSGIGILTSGQILSGSVTKLMAGYWVKLNTGFTVELGAELTVEMNGCITP